MDNLRNLVNDNKANGKTAAAFIAELSQNIVDANYNFTKIQSGVATIESNITTIKNNGLIAYGTLNSEELRSTTGKKITLSQGTLLGQYIQWKAYSDGTLTIDGSFRMSGGPSITRHHDGSTEYGYYSDVIYVTFPAFSYNNKTYNLILSQDLYKSTDPDKSNKQCGCICFDGGDQGTPIEILRTFYGTEGQNKVGFCRCSLAPTGKGALNGATIRFHITGRWQ